MVDVSVVIPSLNQSAYLEEAIDSVLSQQGLRIELIIMDGGSSDRSLSIIKKYEKYLLAWTSKPDNGQASAINSGIKLATGKYIAWLNSDDYYVSGALLNLFSALEAFPSAPFSYGKVLNFSEKKKQFSPVWVEDFSIKRLAFRCIISQPGTLIRHSCWKNIKGLNEQLVMAMDYDLWWRLIQEYGAPHMIHEVVAVNREHSETKTSKYRYQHYNEAIQVVRKHHGHVSWKWWLAQPYAVWYKSFVNKLLA